MSKAVSAWKAWREQTHMETESERLGDNLCAEVEKMEKALRYISRFDDDGAVHAGRFLAPKPENVAYSKCADIARSALND